VGVASRLAHHESRAAEDDQLSIAHLADIAFVLFDIAFGAVDHLLSPRDGAARRERPLPVANVESRAVPLTARGSKTRSFSARTPA